MTQVVRTDVAETRLLGGGVESPAEVAVFDRLALAGAEHEVLVARPKCLHPGCAAEEAVDRGHDGVGPLGRVGLHRNEAEVAR